jgi:hypothetical protein
MTAPTEEVSVGERIAVFKPTTSNIVAGFILSSLCFAGGIAAIGFPLRGASLANWSLPFEAKTGWCWFAVGGFCAMGIILTIGGVVTAAYSRGLISRCVEICQGGFRYCSQRSTVGVPWTSVSSITETILYERPPLLKGPAKLLLPKFKSKSYRVVTCSAQEYAFDGDSIKEIARFGEILREQANRLSIAWVTVEEHG